MTGSAWPFPGGSNRKRQLAWLPFSDFHTFMFAEWSDLVSCFPTRCRLALGAWCGAGTEPPSLSTQFLCTVIAIVLHYVYMSTFAWTFVESLHVYRMLTEVRNIDAGPMRFYYVVGWGVPAIITGEDSRTCSAGVAWAGNPPLFGGFMWHCRQGSPSQVSLPPPHPRSWASGLPGTGAGLLRVLFVAANRQKLRVCPLCGWVGRYECVCLWRVCVWYVWPVCSMHVCVCGLCGLHGLYVLYVHTCVLHVGHACVHALPCMRALCM